ncbi:MAG: hypothetical protein Q4B79_06565 [Moraxella sp.]|uniref:hypothetical protein n=1 Tax=Moraxella sp. TaxID=479 RepID=UPI0026DA781B|nr:hypothetical protein [Moraxella sp.]MDO4450601.1 hypothetical protein [Moraxella sp.]
MPFIREISNDKSTVANTKIHNQKLLDDITQIINENTTRTDEWVHIGYLGSQLKNKGYNPKDLGFKTFGLLLANAWGITHKKVGSGDYFTLADQSNIQPANKTKAIKPKYNLDLQSTHFYQILLRNKMVISHKIQQFLDGGQEIDINDFLNLIIKNIPKEMMLDDKSNHECFLMFIEYELIQFKLIYKDNKAIFAHEYTIKPH